MLRHATFQIALAILAAGCGSAPPDEAPAAAISMSAADNLIPGQLARGAALQTEIRSAGNDCNKVIRTFDQGVSDGQAVWNAECEGGDAFGVVSNADGTTEVMTCDQLKQKTGTACFETF